MRLMFQGAHRVLGRFFNKIQPCPRYVKETVKKGWVPNELTLVIYTAFWAMANLAYLPLQIFNEFNE